MIARSKWSASACKGVYGLKHHCLSWRCLQMLVTTSPEGTASLTCALVSARDDALPGQEVANVQTTFTAFRHSQCVQAARHVQPCCGLIHSVDAAQLTPAPSLGRG